VTSGVSSPDVEVRAGRDGAFYLRDRRPLDHYPPRITDWLDDWAARAGGRSFLAERSAEGAWTHVTYAAARDRVRSVAQALLDRRLSADRPVLILSGNSIEHALLALAAMYAGVLYAPVSPAYSLQSRDLSLLKDIAGIMRPGLVFASDGVAYERALNVMGPDVEVLTSLAGLTPRTDISALDAAHMTVGPDTIAKILFTSGSTGRPKGVINTQRMLCSNQAMLRAVFPFLSEEPPILCDWLPWHHTAGGNHNFGLVLANGGTLYIDDGRPTPDGIDAMARNISDVAPTAHFTVPRTYEALLPFLKSDDRLRSQFFRRLRFFFYAAAGLNARYFDELQTLAVQTTGRELLWVTGLGSTETAPFAVCTGSAGAHAGFVGFPVPGVQLKLAPEGLKLEARVRGPNVSPGYWRDQTLTTAAFDDEGYYRMGDALRPFDPADFSKGLMFDGRLTEDFKLSSGTWVSVGPLRARLLLHLAPYLQDAVIAAPDRAFVGALLVPNLGACRRLCANLTDDAPLSTVVARPEVRDTFARLLGDMAAESPASSTHVARAILVDAPPSIDLGEVTDKGSLNQKRILQNRAALVEELYATSPSARVIAV
jgi:feruloyl-CoA synthase